MERILLTGSNEVLTQHFMALYSGLYDMRLLTRHPKAENHFYWNPLHDELDPKALEGVDHILHLAGSSASPLALDLHQRNLLWSYRAGGTALIGRMLLAQGLEVKTFITGSSTTFYGNHADPYIHTEASAPGDDFLAQLHEAGEEEAYLLEVEALAKRSVTVRFGNILCHYGGVLPHFALGSDKGIALIFGKGEQVIPWVHISDAARTLSWIIRHSDMYDTYNCVAPEWVTYQKLVTTVAYMRSGRTFPIHLPKVCLRTIREELAEQYLHSNRVSSLQLIKSGFTFRYPTIQQALTSIYDL